MSEIRNILAKMANKIGVVQSIYIVTMDGVIVDSYPEVPEEQVETLQKYHYNLLDAVSKILGINRWGNYEEMIIKTSNRQILFFPLIEPDFYIGVVLPKEFTNLGIVKVVTRGAVKELQPYLSL